jgi:hypothetical protein
MPATLRIQLFATEESKDLEEPTHTLTVSTAILTKGMSLQMVNEVCIDQDDPDFIAKLRSDTVPEDQQDLVIHVMDDTAKHKEAWETAIQVMEHFALRETYERNHKLHLEQFEVLTTEEYNKKEWIKNEWAQKVFKPLSNQHKFDLINIAQAWSMPEVLQLGRLSMSPTEYLDTFIEKTMSLLKKAHDAGQSLDLDYEETEKQLKHIPTSAEIRANEPHDPLYNDHEGDFDECVRMFRDKDAWLLKHVPETLSDEVKKEIVNTKMKLSEDVEAVEQGAAKRLKINTVEDSGSDEERGAGGGSSEEEEGGDA